MLLKWQEYDTPFEVKDKDPSQIATERVFNGFFDSHRKFQIISPLIDEKYKENQNKLNKEGEKLLNELFEIEHKLNKNVDTELSQKYKKNPILTFCLSTCLSLEFIRTVRNSWTIHLAD